MKKLILSAAILATLASCNYNNTIATNYEAIQFGNNFVENSVRAAQDPSYNNTTLKSFNVYGTVNGADDNPVAIFNGEAVSGTVGANSVWTCTKTQYWIAGAEYNFAAVVDANDVNLGENLLPETLEYTADGSTDLLYARSEEDIVGKVSGNGLVAFEFAHLLSKVKFTVKNSTAVSDYKYTVKDITISDAYATGVYTIGNATPWEGDGTYPTVFGTIADVTCVSKDTKSGVEGSGVECAEEKLLIPGKTTLKVEFTVDLYYNNSLMNSTAYTGNNAKVVTIDGGLLPGNAYNITLALGLENPIQFTVETAPGWTDAANNPSVDL